MPRAAAGERSTQPCGGTSCHPIILLSLTPGKGGSLELMREGGQLVPTPELPESHTRPFCGLAWTDTPAKSQTNSLKATSWGHVLRDPPDPGEDTSGTFSLQSLVGDTDHQNAPRLLPGPVPCALAGRGGPPAERHSGRSWQGTGGELGVQNHRSQDSFVFPPEPA